VRNTGHLSKLDRALDEPAQGRTPHTHSRSCFTEGRSVQDRFHCPHIAQKMVPLLFIEMRVIKGRKHIGWLSSLFLLNVGYLRGELSLDVAAF
jgi:hypothetical protein